MDSPFTQQCYNMLLQLEYAGRFTWATHIKSLLFTFGIGYVWIVQDVGDSEFFLAMFRQRLPDCFEQKLNRDITSSSKSDHYQHYKSFLDVEQYLSVDLNHKLKRTLANFRCSCHELMADI